MSWTNLFFLNPTPFVERLMPKMNKDKYSNGSEVTICVNNNHGMCVTGVTNVSRQVNRSFSFELSTRCQTPSHGHGRDVAHIAWSHDRCRTRPRWCPHRLAGCTYTRSCREVIVWLSTCPQRVRRHLQSTTPYPSYRPVQDSWSQTRVVVMAGAFWCYHTPQSRPCRFLLQTQWRVLSTTAFGSIERWLRHLFENVGGPEPVIVQSVVRIRQRFQSWPQSQRHC